mgnify:CR=1 FL=1
MKASLILVASLIIGLSHQQQKPDINKDLDWIQVQREAVTKIIVFVCLLGLVGLIIWKVWDVKNTVVKNKVLMEEFEDQIEMIEDGSDEFVISSIKDKRDGIHFFDNPLRAFGYSDHITKMQELNKKVYRLKRQIA